MPHKHSTTTELELDGPVEHDGRMAGVVVGIFLGFTEQGELLVDYPGNPIAHAMRARTTTAIDAADRGRDAALLFEDGDPMRPIVVGLLQASANVGRTVSVERDGETVEIRAEHELVLRCGEASITLTRAGKVLIRGKYVLSRSSGVNMVKGGIVRLN